MSARRELLKIARGNHGVFTLADARRVGCSEEVVRRAVERGWFTRVAVGVYVTAGTPRTPEQAVAAALAFHPGAVASHECAAWLWGLPGYRSSVVLTIDRGRNQRTELGTLRSTGVLPPSHRGVRRGLAVTSAARTVFDLAGVEHRGRVERSLDHALTRKLCTLDQVAQVHAALAGRGRRGSSVMRDLLTARGEGYVAPASELERRARALFERGRLPLPSFEVEVGGSRWVGRVDCLWREQRVIVELDGRRYHEGRTRMEADRRRDNELMAQGWIVLRFGWSDLEERPAAVVATIRRALASRS